MYTGNWTCSSCGGGVTELPFEPRSEKGLTCRSCWSKQKKKESAQAPEMESASVEAPNDIPDDAGLAGEQEPVDDLGMDAVPASNEKPTFTGDWKCSSCGAAITTLPFEPRGAAGLKCIDCFKKSKA